VEKAQCHANEEQPEGEGKDEIASKPKNPRGWKEVVRTERESG
jgi:hypothetical protein